MAVQAVTEKRDFRFAELGKPNSIWAIPSVHGAVDRLQSLHDQLFDKIQPGDRVIYLGNMVGIGASAKQTVDELLAFRRSILSKHGMLPTDLVYLRGSQEEMLQKLMQIQFATNPRQILEWMLSQGLSATLESYGITIQEGLDLCGVGVIPLSRWTEHVRKTIYACPGHEQYMAQLRRAAYTDTHETPESLLFVNSGLDMNLPLHQQGDRFWWGQDDFQSYERPYQPFHKIIRGYDPLHRGLHLNCVTATLDNGCGFGGSLICARLLQGQGIEPVFTA